MLELIRQKLLKGEYIITRRAQRRCDTRNISIEEIKHVILTGEIVENYPRDKPYPQLPYSWLCAEKYTALCLVCNW